VDQDNQIRSSLFDPFEQPSAEVVRLTLGRSLDILTTEHQLPFGYRLEPWCQPLIPAFAASMAVAFSDSPDLEIYPALGSREGCLRLMNEIVEIPGFLSGACWLVFFDREPCAHILSSQAFDSNSGEIMSIGIAPRHRRLGVGTHLVNKTLWALHDRKCNQASAKVNRSNRGAIRFFRSLGFQASASQEYI
jgi:GNAT superfamily N-acetyltransferase